ncbi:MAG TPA: hypothetical protein DIU19_07930 [Alcanivorax sp.]|mgnify:FL=1|jgi:hypothetical protein|uniref:hypothetical protein n=1 Tax=Alloalcanivorax venustensis TaxID=172371 RepID=UPI000C8C0F53|nr:hypothetical protein [Alcanivorax sp.]QVL44285.1 MAG: hypothetical protein KFB92_06860 [Alcanivorax sp.]HAD44306.1 hypothetical protein [Alcanivorax sp.]HAD64215.1 hypothetical protein [Alcanivorax sp.]HAI88704.1 hypothetical protein [Alcanivorax sp.]|tara:strand:- start:1227 stop:1544 length:318 start_codon:yes stop_codon:yes gene_type:complete
MSEERSPYAPGTGSAADAWVDRLLERGRGPELAPMPLNTPLDGTHVTAAVRLTGRDRFHLARVLGVDLPTLEHWERGLGAPDGAAHALLLIALRFPEVIRAFSTD